MAAAPGSSRPCSSVRVLLGQAWPPSLWRVVEYLARSGVKGLVCNWAWKSPVPKPPPVNAIAAEEGRQGDKAGTGVVRNYGSMGSPGKVK